MYDDFAPPPVPTALLESTTAKDYLEGQSVVNTPVLELKKKLDLGPKIPYQEALTISYELLKYNKEIL